MSRRNGRDGSDNRHDDRREADRRWAKATEKVIDARLDRHITHKETVDRLAELGRVYRDTEGDR